jgi:hypothetical protein
MHTLTDIDALRVGGPTRPLPARRLASGVTLSTLALLMVACSGLDPAAPTQPEGWAILPVRPEVPPGAPCVAPQDAATQAPAPTAVALPAAAPRATAKPVAAAPRPPAAPAPNLGAPATPDARQPLDLKALENRLKETRALGVFTKLALKNQIDDLLAQLRTHHGGGSPKSLVPLRASYERLLVKVLGLLQDADPSLALAISDSREAIWGVLSNPAKFSSVAAP